MLDIGCGLGHLASCLAAAEVDHSFTGLDFSPVAVERARSLYPDHQFVEADLTEPSLLQRLNFDVATATEFLEHIPGDTNVLSHLPKGTYFVGSVPDFDSFGHVRHFHSATAVTKRYESYFEELVVEEIYRGPSTYFMLSGTRS